MGRNVDIRSTPPNVTTNDAISTSTAMDIDKSLIFVTCLGYGSTTCMAFFIVGKLFFLGLISTPPHLLLLKTHDFVK